MSLAGWLGHIDYLLAGLLLVAGLHGMLSRTHLVRKLIAMNVMQVSVIVFFVALAAKHDAQPPLAGNEVPILASTYVNPLPHALMLTAIVVGVSTTGVALALLIRIHGKYGTLDEAELLERLRE